MNQEPDQTELLRELIENLDAFRDTVTETIKILHKRQKKLTETVSLQGLLLWFILGTLIVGLLAFVAFLLTR